MSQVSISLESGTARVILTVFGVLVALVALGFVLKAFAAPFEIGLSVSLHDFFESGPVWGVSAAISSYMTYAFLGGFAVLIAYPRTRRLGICLGIQVLITWFFQEFVIKNIVLRPRPYVYLDIPSPLKQMSDFTYFSGHSQALLSIAGFFWNHRRRIQIVFIAVGLFVMLTRIIVYAHYLSDVTVGALFGFAGGMFFYLWETGRLPLRLPRFMRFGTADPGDGRARSRPPSSGMEGDELPSAVGRPAGGYLTTLCGSLPHGAETGVHPVR